ncbi:MAG: alanine racemase [Candidatus Dependentiae bacterium]
MLSVHPNQSQNCCLNVALCKHIKTWVEISRSALIHNILQYKNIVGDTLLAPVVKSNAYGHDIGIIAQILNSLEAVSMLCVVSLSEAMGLRMLGITKPLLVLSIIDAHVRDAISNDIELVAYDFKTICYYNEVAKKLQKKALIHLKIDTGLSRIGACQEEAIALVNSVVRLEFIQVSGIFSHLANSEREKNSFAETQIVRFANIVQQLEKDGIHIPLRHISCSAAITALDMSHFTMARLGIGIYGLWPSLENALLTKQKYPTFSLKPVMTWKTKPIQIKQVPSGTSIGYDCTYITQRETKVATLPIGYWDGYDRGFSNNGYVVVKGIKAAIIGRIAMNLMMVDITDIPQVTLDDEIILLGEHPDVHADQLADRIKTINYEIVTRINPSIKRFIVE